MQAVRFADQFTPIWQIGKGSLDLENELANDECS